MNDFLSFIVCETYSVLSRSPSNSLFATVFGTEANMKQMFDIAVTVTVSQPVIA